MNNNNNNSSNNGGADAGGGSGGERALCWEAFAAALEAVPFTLAENCGLAPVRVLTELREAHERGERAVGVDVRRGRVADLSSGAGRVLQPALVTLRAVALAAECVQMVLKIDSVLETVKS